MDAQTTLNNWLVVSTLRKILVSWGYYSQYMEKSKMIQTTNQTNNIKQLVETLASQKLLVKTSLKMHRIRGESPYIPIYRIHIS